MLRQSRVEILGQCVQPAFAILDQQPVGRAGKCLGDGPNTLGLGGFGASPNHPPVADNYHPFDSILSGRFAQVVHRRLKFRRVNTLRLGRGSLPSSARKEHFVCHDRTNRCRQEDSKHQPSNCHNAFLSPLSTTAQSDISGNLIVCFPGRNESKSIS